MLGSGRSDGLGSCWRWLMKVFATGLMVTGFAALLGCGAEAPAGESQEVEGGEGTASAELPLPPEEYVDPYGRRWIRQGPANVAQRGALRSKIGRASCRERVSVLVV